MAGPGPQSKKHNLHMYRNQWLFCLLMGEDWAVLCDTLIRRNGLCGILEANISGFCLWLGFCGGFYYDNVRVWDKITLLSCCHFTL